MSSELNTVFTKDNLDTYLKELAEQEKRHCPLSMAQISNAMQRLYGGWDSVSVYSRQFIENIMRIGNYKEAYDFISKEEKKTIQILQKNPMWTTYYLL